MDQVSGWDGTGFCYALVSCSHIAIVGMLLGKTFEGKVIRIIVVLVQGKSGSGFGFKYFKIRFRIKMLWFRSTKISFTDQQKLFCCVRFGFRVVRGSVQGLFYPLAESYAVRVSVITHVLIMIRNPLSNTVYLAFRTSE